MVEDTFLAFDSPKESSSYIKVIGVGGGGSNAVNHMFNQGIKGVDFIVCNTDEKALNDSPVSNKIALDRLGAGNNPKVACDAAERHADEIREALSHNTQMLFITAGMGGGTGTGAAPVIAQIAKSIDLEDDITGKILVVAIVTMPFSFEGRRRKEQAEAGIAELRKYVDSILVINNDKLRAFGDKGISGAFALANDVLLTAAKGIAEIITANALVNIDFRDVNTVMNNSGTALMGTGEGRGENRAMDAIQNATTSVLLNDNDISGAKDALLYISYGKDHEVSMDELTAITDYVESQIQNHDCTIIWGYGEDDNLSDEIKVTLIATGFEQKNLALPGSEKPAFKKPIVLTPDQPKPEPVQEPVDDTEMHIVNHTSEVEVKAEETAPIEEVTTAPTNTIPAASVQTEAPTPVATPKFEPEAQFHTEGTKRIFDLGMAAATEETEVETAEPEYRHDDQNDDMLDLKLVTPQQEEEPVAVQQPAPEPIAEPKVETAPIQQAEPQRVVVEAPAPMQQNRVNENEAMSRADRIKRLHDLLTKNPNGPQMVEDMDLRHGYMNNATSHLNEGAGRTMNADGSLNLANPYLFDNPD